MKEKKTLRAALCALLCGAMLLSGTAVPTARAAGFSDVTDQWFAADLNKAVEYQLINGYGGVFGVGQKIDRSSFAVLLVRLMGWETVNVDGPSLPDVPVKEWYAAGVETALAHGVIDGGRPFRPLEPITRAEMAVMLVRALGYQSLAARQTGRKLPFADVYHNTGEIAVAYDLGLITGYWSEGALWFAPEGTANREDAAVLLARMYEKCYGDISWLHGFYAISSYGKIGYTAAMDAVSVGWARLDFDPENGPWVNQTKADGNEWTLPAGAAEATGYFARNGVPCNLNVFCSAWNRIALNSAPEGEEPEKVSTLAAVTSPGHRAAAVAALAEAAEDYAGLTIDFEGVKAADSENYLAFMAELRAALSADKALYVCVSPNDWYAYDYRALGELCDKVILMAHDYQWSSIPDYYVGTANTDCPITPFPRVYDALRAITDGETGVRDKNKIALAISFAALGFRVDEAGKILDNTFYRPSQATLARRLSQPDTAVTWVEEHRNPYAVYTTEDGGRYKIWFESPESVMDKIDLARMFGVEGVSLWYVGSIPDDPANDVWSALSARR